MLLRFSATNYRSLKDEQELSMIAGGLGGRASDLLRYEAAGLNVLPVAAIYGANASGKTNVLKALHFMASAVEDSHTSWKPGQGVPYVPFRLDPKTASQPSTFEIDFVVKGNRYQYGFSLDSKRVQEEWLNAFPTNRRQVWFHRKKDDFTLGKKLVGENRTIKNTTRPDSLFLSAAAQNNHEQLLPVYLWFSSLLTFVTDDRETTRFRTMALCDDAAIRAKVERALAAADLGLIGFETTEGPVDDGLRKVFAAMEEAFPEGKGKRLLPEKIQDVLFSHRALGETSVKLGVHSESLGTLSFFSLLGPVFAALSQGGVICIDELDSSLHPLLAIELVKLFNDTEKNPLGAQLVFNTHDTNLLDPEVLRRDQIWFTEKDQRGATHLYPLTDFRPRETENLQRGYLQGRYGAVPFLGERTILSRTARRGS